MLKKRLALGLLLSAAWLGLAGPRSLAAQLVPLGPEVDLHADTFPRKPLVGVHSSGASLVAWDEGYDSHAGIFYRYVPSGGMPPEEEWPTTIGIEDHFPSIDAVTAAAKGFDVLWHEPVSGKPTAFYRQHLTLQGEPDGPPIRLGGAGIEWVWQVRGNGFMAGWALPRKRTIVARRLGSSGGWVGPEIRLNSRPIRSPKPVVVLAVADGGFLAVWAGVAPGTPTTVLRARRFTAKGKPLGPDFDVNTLSLNADPEFKVAAAPGGGFAVAWKRADRIYLRLFTASGSARGPEVPAATLKDPEDGPESMAFDNAGNLLLLWREYGDDAGLLLQLFGPLGAPVGSTVGVRSEASDIFDAPWGGNVAWAGNSWLVAWGAGGSPSYDFSTVFLRRFARKP